MDTQSDTQYVIANDLSKLADFEEKFRIKISDSSVVSTIVGNYFRSFSLRKSILGRFPILETLRTYKWKAYVLQDFISGIMSGLMMIPLGMAFASLSTLPNVVGLYMSFFASITYFVFGTSRHLSWGCVAVVSQLLSNLLMKYDNSEEAISFISSLNESEQTANILLHKETNSPNPDVNKLLTLDGTYVTNAMVVTMMTRVKNITVKNNILEVISVRRIEVASSCALISGVVLVLESMIGFSYLLPILSNSLMSGFTVGIAFKIAITQLSIILGLSIKKYSGNFSVFETFYEVVNNIQETNIADLIISVICIIIMYLVKRFVNEKFKHRMKVSIPIEIFIVVGALLISKYYNLNKSYDVNILGSVPTGLPAPKVPNVRLILDYNYIIDALFIAIIAHVQSYSTAKMIAPEGSQTIEPGQEMFATGMCSVVCAMFSGYIPSSYIPISMAQRDAGGVTQIASLFAAGIVLVMILTLGPYMYAFPSCVMSAIVLVNLRPLFIKVFNIRQEWRRSNSDCIVSVVTCIATIVLEFGNALIVSVAFSVLYVVLLRSVINPVVEVVPIQMNHNSALILRRAEHYSSVKTLFSVRLIKIKTPLYFFNSERFVNAVLMKTNTYRTHAKILRHGILSKFGGKQAFLSDEDKRKLSSKTTETTPLVSKDKENTMALMNKMTLILDMSEVSFMDGMGVEALDFVVNELQSTGIRVMITSVSDNVFDILQTTGFWNKQRDCLITDIQSALSNYHRNHNVRETTKDLSHQSDQWV